MPTFIKPGFWNKKKYKLNGELDLDKLIQTFIPPTTSTTTTQTPYKVYTATISQNSTSAPTVDNVFQNTIGGITFSYNNPGEYIINSSGLFTNNKTAIIVSPGRPLSGGVELGSQVASTNSIMLYSRNNLGVLTNSIIALVIIEIRVYN